jgi:hypothetical protein
MRRLILLASVLLGACSSNETQISRFHDDGRAKPVVAVAQLIDTTSIDMPWSLSEELTTSIVKKLSQTGAIFVKIKEDLAYSENPFGQDLSWVKREFPEEEFAVFLELVRHEAVPAVKGKPKTDVSHNLEMAVRARVIDLRGHEPRIVLQEMVKDAYFIPKTLIPTDYSRAVWGTDEFRKSPMGIAHAGLVQEISLRLSDYILLAKSR